jgi:hypothetical protein
MQVTYHIYEYDENDNQKRNFSKTLSRVELFENDTVSYSCARMKTYYCPQFSTPAQHSLSC